MKGQRSTTWSDVSGRVVARIWSGNELRYVQRGLHVIAGWPIKVTHRLVGHFSEIELDVAGYGIIRQDPFGLHPLYIGSIPGITLIANRPYLVATGLERLTGKPAGRDQYLAAWLTLSGTPTGDRTGYEGVSCVPFGASVSIGTDYSVKYLFARPPWLTGRLTGKTDDTGPLIDRIESELIANLRRAVAVMGHPPRLCLTGGRDSRLVLALALRAGLLNDIEVVTYGPSEAPDAVIARELTHRLGIRHTQLQWNDSVTRNLRTHVGFTAGALNCIDSWRSLSSDGRISLQGIGGETLGTSWPNRFEYRDEQSVIEGFLSRLRGTIGILKREACIQALTYGLQSILALVEGGTRYDDLFDAYYIQHRLRRWVSGRPERHADEFFPLYYPPAVEVAYQMGWGDRNMGRIHNIIIERVGRRVSEPLYYKPGAFYKTRKELLDKFPKRVSPELRHS